MAGLVGLLLIRIAVEEFEAGALSLTTMPE